MNKQLLKNTLELIKNNQNHWNQRHWHCGTSHCFAGFVELQTKNLPVDTYEDDPRLVGDSILSSTNHVGRVNYIAMDALNINDELANLLFNANNTLEELTDIVEVLTKDTITVEDLSNFSYLQKLAIIFGEENLSIDVLRVLDEDEDGYLVDCLYDRDNLPEGF